MYAKTDPEGGSKGITAFVIEKTMAGFTPAQKLDKWGMRGSTTSELVFEDCKVPESAVLGKVGGGVGVLMSGLDSERLVLSGGPLGIMHSVMDSVVPYLSDRKQFGQSIGSFQLMQGKVADMYTRLATATALTYNTAREADKNGTDRGACAASILYASDASVEVALEGIQSLGGNGYINEYPTGRLLADAKLYSIGAGTQEIRRFLIGRELLSQ